MNDIFRNKFIDILTYIGDYVDKKILITCASILFKKKLNLIIFALESISQKDIEEKLDISSRNHNRNIILNLYNTKRLKSLIEENFIQK